MMNIQKTLLVVAILILSLSAQIAQAASLHQPKSEGWIGEQTNGYIGFVKTGASNDLKILVSDVNAKRREIYAGLAAKQGVSLGQIETVAGEHNIEKTSEGEFVQDSSGSWIKK